MGREPSQVFDGDRNLLDRFRAGDRSALEQVYWAYVDPIERLVRRCLSSASGRGSPGTMPGLEDLVQDVFTRAFSRAARQSYDGLRDYGPYLFTIARNAVADALRSGRREMLADVDLIDGLALPEAGGPDAGPDWADPVTLACVRDYLARLPPDLEAVYQQRYVVGLSQDAAAVALGSSRQRFRTLEKKLRAGLSRALKVMRVGRRLPQISPSPALRQE